MCDSTPLPLHSMSSAEKRSQQQRDQYRILEKRIDIPGIVLTEADSESDYELSCSPTSIGGTGRKQVVLLSPCTVYCPRVRRPMAPTARSIVILILVILAAYHLYTHLDLLHVQVPQAAVPI